MYHMLELVAPLHLQEPALAHQKKDPEDDQKNKEIWHRGSQIPATDGEPCYTNKKLQITPISPVIDLCTYLR